MGWFWRAQDRGTVSPLSVIARPHSTRCCPGSCPAEFPGGNVSSQVTRCSMYSADD